MQIKPSFSNQPISLNNQNITLGISGGVDSSVSAHLLKKSDYQVNAVFMKNWVDLEGNGDCPIESDLTDAKQVCKNLDIPFNAINFAPEYWDHVFEHFLSEYRLGRTPNPDILCNKEVKFKLFLNYAIDHGADCIATGHYARIHQTENGFQLLKAKDLSKDQSYFLYTLNQHQLSKSIFPLGDLLKTDVRLIAKENNIITHNKKDSTGICFIGERNFQDFLSQFIPTKTGEIQTADGKVLGEHQGVMYYTLGQRKGLGIGGKQQSLDEPWFVVGKNISENILIVEQGHNHPLLLSDSLVANDLHWISGEMPELPYSCTAKTRYRQNDVKCIITDQAQNGLTVKFENNQRAMTPGQSIVFYNGDVCLGGGIINKVANILFH